MSDTVSKHRENAPESASFAVLTLSDTRTIETDVGGATIVDLAVAAGHRILERQIIPDDATLLADQIMRLIKEPNVDAILVTGGTGISHRDQTYETISALLTRPLPGYGELFRHLSFHEIGPAAMLSRTLGGVIDETLLLTMPGSPAAVRLAMEKLILPEIGHLLAEIRR
jgi:molybdenum cofactor biosynthesis protein B